MTFQHLLSSTCNLIYCLGTVRYWAAMGSLTTYRTMRWKPLSDQGGDGGNMAFLALKEFKLPWHESDPLVEEALYCCIADAPPNGNFSSPDV